MVRKILSVVIPRFPDGTPYKNPIKVTKSKAKSLLKENGVAKFTIGKIEKKLKIKLNGIHTNFEETK